VKRKFDLWFIVIAVVLGLASGYVHLVAPDPTIVALLALVCAMFLGLMRPAQPWLWALIIAFSIPAADLYANLTGQPIYRGRIEGAFVAGLVSGLVGSYAGSVTHRMVVRVFSQKS
jgi:hypothetical protein